MKPLEPELDALSLTNQIRQAAALLQGAAAKIAAQLPDTGIAISLQAWGSPTDNVCVSTIYPKNSMDARVDSKRFPLADLDAGAVLAWCRDKAQPEPGK
jgi:hypothetical protein